MSRIEESFMAEETFQNWRSSNCLTDGELKWLHAPHGFTTALVGDNLLSTTDHSVAHDLRLQSSSLQCAARRRRVCLCLPSISTLRKVTKRMDVREGLDNSAYPRLRADGDSDGDGDSNTDIADDIVPMTKTLGYPIYRPCIASCTLHSRFCKLGVDKCVNMPLKLTAIKLTAQMFCGTCSLRGWGEIALLGKSYRQNMIYGRFRRFPT
jgi:hypothetical protein